MQFKPIGSAEDARQTFYSKTQAIKGYITHEWQCHKSHPFPRKVRTGCTVYNMLESVYGDSLINNR